MFRRESVLTSLLGLVALGLCGLGLGFASNYFLPTAANDPPGADVPESAGWWTPTTAGVPDEKPRGEPIPAPRAAQSGKRALLIGVTKYDNLSAGSQLSGPGNDVRLLRTTLVGRYGFPPENIVSLTEDEGKPELRPTRANIAREFKRLAETAQPGDQVVVLLAGHGDRQPEADPPDPASPEPDGIDEIFLPADVTVWKGYPDRVPNAIVDNEIRDWLAAVTARKAHVWAIFDCCHSGSMTRWAEAVRQLPAGVLVPQEELAKARERAARRTGRPAVEQPEKGQPFATPESDSYLVAMFACAAHETTPESPQPANSRNARYHGLLTYSVVSGLEQSAASAAPLTYRELMQRVQLSYLSRPQGSPTPTVVGVGQDRVVLGTDKPIRPRITFARVKDEYVVNVGDLHGVTSGSVLRVYSPAGEKKAPQLLGHVRVEESRALDSTVTPVEFDGKPKPTELPTAGLCEVAAVDCSSRQIRVGIDPDKEKPDEAKRQITKALGSLREWDAGLFKLVDDAKTAHFLVRLTASGPELADAAGSRPPIPLPALNSDLFGGSLTDKLMAIYRARSLIAVGARLEGERSRGTAGPDIKIEALRHRSRDDPGTVLERPADGWVFRSREMISFRVTNTSQTKRLEVTLLVIDPDYQIQVFHPGRTEINKALEPGASFQTPVGRVTDKPPFGPEHMVAIVTAPTNPSVDYRLLIQPGVRGRGDTSKSPLAQLLENSLHGAGSRSGLTVSELEDQGARVLNWRTEPAAKK